ncbi:MAG: sporulation protein YqfD [Clostridiales bacterium]|nr:sporulation protein YqfD [Clostridiales bacterium]
MRSGCVRLRVEGYNQLRLLNALNREDIAVFDFLREKSTECLFSVSKKDAPKTFAILNELCYTYKVTGDSGAVAFLKTAARRSGLLLTVVLLTACILFLRGFMWRVEISGCSAVPQKTVERVLATVGVKTGGKISAFDARAAETAVRGIEGVKLASVRRNGTTVRVEIFESDEVAPPLAGSTTDILSSFDATVTRVVAREGTALVRPGQHVFAGTPLIGAYRQNAEGEQIPSAASGTVYGRVTHTVSVTVSQDRYVFVPVGTRKRTLLRVFGLTIGKPLQAGGGTTVESRAAKLNVFLPVTVIRQKSVAYEKRLVHESVETLAQKEEQKALAEFVSRVASTGFTASHTVRDLGGGQFRVNVFIEAEAVIGGA